MDRQARDHARFYVEGCALVPGHIARKLDQLLNLHALRIRTRGQDAEFDDVLLALHLAAINDTTISRPRNSPASQQNVANERMPVTATSHVGAKAAAQQLGITARRVQQLAAAGLIPAKKFEGRWIFDTNTLHERGNHDGRH